MLGTRTGVPGWIAPLVTPSGDPSFPSNPAAVAFAVVFVSRRGGAFFLAWATLIAACRVLAGVSYPSDILTGAVIGLGVASVAAWPGRRVVAGLSGSGRGRPTRSSSAPDA